MSAPTNEIESCQHTALVHPPSNPTDCATDDFFIRYATTILNINKLALELVAKDFSDGHAPNNGGPTKTSRALAITHLAARDAYAQVIGTYAPRLGGLPAKAFAGDTDALGTVAVVGAGIRTATLLYPDFASYIAEQSAPLTAGLDTAALTYGCLIGEKWVQSRQSDGSALPQNDALYSAAPGHHRPDPVSKSAALGRTYGNCPPFVIGDVTTDAPLGPPPALTSAAYAKSFDDVHVNGRDNITDRTATFRQHALVGLFWGYDGANKLGTPPRLYNQVVLKSAEFQALPNSVQINVLAAINAAMADAGIAAWYWKYTYDFWRPVVAIREASVGFGPSKLGDGNTLRKHKGDPFWNPLGAPRSNPATPVAAGAAGDNFTPNFPAYPLGHATFGTACFETFAKLIGKLPKDISVSFISDEFNGTTTDNTGSARPVWEQTFTLQEAIDQNKISRIYLGVHWDFDANGGDIVGQAIASKVAAAF